MSRKNHFQGKKGGKHTTIIDAAGKIIHLIEKFPEVKKISPGLIKSRSAKGGKGGFKVIGISGGILLKIKGVKSVQDIRIYSNDIDGILKKIEKEF